MANDTRKKISKAEGYAVFDYVQSEAANGRGKISVDPDQVDFTSSDDSIYLNMTAFTSDCGKVDHWRVVGDVDGSRVSWDQVRWMLPDEIFKKF